MLGKTARFYRKNKAAYKRKLAKANTHPVWGEQTPARRKKRVENGKARRKAEKKGRNIKGLHHQHNSSGSGDTFVSAKSNLSTREKSRRRGSKRNKRTFGKAIKKALCKAIKKAL